MKGHAPTRTRSRLRNLPCHDVARPAESKTEPYTRSFDPSIDGAGDGDGLSWRTAIMIAPQAPPAQGSSARTDMVGLTGQLGAGLAQEKA